jgi:hypothetical protein
VLLVFAVIALGVYAYRLRQRTRLPDDSASEALEEDRSPVELSNGAVPPPAAEGESNPESDSDDQEEEVPVITTDDPDLPAEIRLRLPQRRP